MKSYFFFSFPYLVGNIIEFYSFATGLEYIVCKYFNSMLMKWYEIVNLARVDDKRNDGSHYLANLEGNLVFFF